jgi:hypothetical protein
VLLRWGARQNVPPHSNKDYHLLVEVLLELERPHAPATEAYELLFRLLERHEGERGFLKESTVASALECRTGWEAECIRSVGRHPHPITLRLVALLLLRRIGVVAGTPLIPLLEQAVACPGISRDTKLLAKDYWITARQRASSYYQHSIAGP